MRRLPVVLAIAMAAVCLWADDAPARRQRRHVTPITTGATTTQAINETRGDTARINAAFRARSSHYHRDDGAIVYVDTVTGEEWIDSTSIRKLPRMKYPLFAGTTVGVDIWDPVMRIFGQKYGLVGFWADVNLHNRYFPTFEVGLGQASNTPAGEDYTYTSPMSVYFKIGADYNFLYNSNPDYKWLAGVRYGFSPFKWGLTGVTPPPGYWGDTPPFAIANQNVTAGWLEFCLGLRVKLWRGISAGWMIRIHALIHETKNEHGKPWYIPGYGSRGQMITGTFSISYTLPVKGRASMPAADIDTTATPGLPMSLPEQETDSIG